MRKNRKIACFLLAALAVVWGMAAAGTASGAAVQTGAPPGAADTQGPAISAKSAILVEQGTMQPLLEYNADEQLAPASITKVMTLLLVMEELEAGALTYEERVTATGYASSMGGSQIWLEPNEAMSVHDLLKATAVASANDAAVVLAERVSGTEAAFVERMNRRAQELGMTNTHFVNCTGLDEEGHYTSARDIAIMSGELMKHKKILDYTSIWMDELRAGETQLVNTNKLVYHYQGATGLKTGSTDAAGKCLCATATRAGMSLISVVLGAPDSAVQFGDSTRLLDYGFGNFVSEPIQPPDGELPLLKVRRGVLQSAALYTEPPATVVIPRTDAGKLAYEITLSPEATAPVEAGQTVGQVVVHVDSREICSFPIKIRQSIERMTFPRAAGLLWRSLISMGNPPQDAPPSPNFVDDAQTSSADIT